MKHIDRLRDLQDVITCKKDTANLHAMRVSYNHPVPLIQGQLMQQTAPRSFVDKKEYNKK